MSDFVLTDRIYTLPMGERWNVCHRLKELSICCQCPEDGSLFVQINSWFEVVLVCMTLFRFTASRQQQLDWLERNWCLSNYVGG
jgi:hypothetical protein